MANPLVRWEVEPLRNHRRTLDERFSLVAPRLAGTVRGMATALRPGSPLRRALLTRGARVAVAANNRRDYEALCAFYDPEIVIDISAGWEEGFGAGAGLEQTYRGHEGVRRLIEDWRTTIGDATWDLLELADPGGPRVAARVEIVLHGESSGIELRVERGHLWTLRQGRCVREDVFASLDAAVAVLVD